MRNTTRIMQSPALPPVHHRSPMPPCVRIRPSSTTMDPLPTCCQPVRSFPLKSCCQLLEAANAARSCGTAAVRHKSERRCIPVSPEVVSCSTLADRQTGAAKGPALKEKAPGWVPGACTQRAGDGRGLIARDAVCIDPTIRISDLFVKFYAEIF